MNARRIPVLVALVVFAIAMFLAPRPAQTAGGDVAVSLIRTDVLPADDALSSTWFCAGGSGSRGDVNHEVLVTNLSDEVREGTISVLTEDPDRTGGEPISVPPGETRTFELGSYVDSEAAGAVVEVDGGLVAVEQRASGALGHDMAACSTSPSATWYFAWGRTTLEASMRLALLNPFSDDAVVDLSFDTDDGYRSPAAYEGLTIRAGTVRVIDVGQEVQRRERIAAQIVARSGRIVADRLQTFAGSEDVSGIDLSLGIAEPSTAWAFAEGRLDDAWSERIVLFNPGTEAAQVVLSVVSGGPDDEASTPIEPFELAVLPRRQIEVVLSDEDRLPTSMAHATLVESVNEVPIVAERVVWSAEVGESTDLAIGPGLAAHAGWGRSSTRVVIPTPIDRLADEQRLVVLNPSTTAGASVEIAVQRGGRVDEIETIDLAPLERAELNPSVWLGDADPATGYSVVIEADEPIVVDRTSWQQSTLGLTATRGLAVDGTDAVLGER